MLWASAFAQQQYPYQQEFDQAYAQYPSVPRGMLEAVAYTQTHIQHLSSNEEFSCSGLPQAIGVFGLSVDPSGYFRNNLQLVAQLSGLSEQDIIDDAETHIIAYAKSLAQLQQANGKVSGDPIVVAELLLELSELPTTNDPINVFASNSFLYSVLNFMSTKEHAITYNFPAYTIDLIDYFGLPTYKQLSANKVNMAGSRSADYAPAIWNAAPSCNYSSRAGTPISAVTIHTIQGSYSSAISWFGNCAAQVSAHYVIRSSDGQVTQMVDEYDKAWHVRDDNPYSIGIEHEGFVNDASWYTVAMYQSSANLSRDITQSGYGINPLSAYTGNVQNVINSCYRIKGHVHFPLQTHTDPGVNWDWPYYHELINDTVAEFRNNGCIGTFVDNGGSNGNYGSFEKYWTIIEPTTPGQIDLSFTTLDLENGYDNLFVYDGDEATGTLIGTYTGSNNPGVVSAYSGKMSILFESDCQNSGQGWEANWNCQSCANPFVSIVDSLKEVECSDPTSGYLALSINGGSGPFTYAWSDGTTGNAISDLTNSTYTVTISDNSGCVRVEQFNIPKESDLETRMLKQDIECGQNTGLVAVSLVSGQGPFSYQWNTGSTDSSFAVTAGGTYHVTVTDALGCTTLDSIAVDTDDFPYITQLSVNVGNRSIVVNKVKGGEPPYTYSWSNGGSSSAQFNLDPGTYSVTIIDDKGCTIDTSVLLGTTGVELEIANNLTIYPNPSTGRVFVKLTSPSSADLQVLDVSGKVVHSATMTSGAGQINLSHLSKGSYFIKVQQEESFSYARAILF